MAAVKLIPVEGYLGHSLLLHCKGEGVGGLFLPAGDGEAKNSVVIGTLAWLRRLPTTTTFWSAWSATGAWK